MKKLSYIIAMILSLLIIYLGAGISIIHYCCNRCETVQKCCTNDYSECEKKHSCEFKKACKEKGGCTTALYKVDLMKHSSEMTVSVPVITLFYELLHQLIVSADVDHSEVHLCFSAPPPACSRQKLAFHSVLII